MAATGSEVVYRNVYRELGLPEAALGRFIAGAPFLPWFLMGNLDGWGGAPPESWYARQEALQKQIMCRVTLRLMNHGLSSEMIRSNWSALLPTPVPGVTTHSAGLNAAFVVHTVACISPQSTFKAVGYLPVRCGIHS